MSSKPEVEWDRTEVDWMKALHHYRTTILCPLCGWPKSVCRAYETDGNVQVEWERCHVTAALARKQNAQAKDESVEVPESLAYRAAVHQPGT